MGSQLHAVFRVVAGHMGNHDNSAFCHCHDVFKNKLTLFHRMINTLTGGAADVKAGNAFADQIFGEGTDALGRDGAVFRIAGIECRENALIFRSVFHVLPFFFIP